MNREFHSVNLGLLLKLALLLSFNFGNYYLSIATEMEVCIGVKGFWLQPNETEPSSFNWKAHWIWTDEALETDAIFARRTVQLSSIPEKAILRITASSKYKLFLNGEYICQGPARSAPHHQSYDILDVSELLKVGENLIAVRVHHQDGKRSYQYDGRAGLLVQLNLEKGATETNYSSDSNWKVIADPSWNSNAPKISRFQQVVNDRTDFRKYLKGWNASGFDDNNWSNATELMRKTGWPAPQKNAIPQPLTSPWTSLVARDIPYLIERDIKADKIIEATLTETVIDKEPIILTGEKDIFVAPGKMIELPASSDSKAWFLLYDFGEVINGMPKLDIQGAPGTEIQIVTAPFIVDNKFSKITVDSEFLDKIILSGKRDRWEATYFKPTRYLGIIVTNAKPVKMYSAGVHEIKYPFEMRGQMSSTDAPWVNDYMKATAKTINVCTTDAYTDNYRERRQYAQTNYYASLGNYYTFGDLALQRRYLIQVAQEQTANGIMPAYAPAAADDYMIILGSNCLWIRGLLNYFLYSGDELTVREVLHAAEKSMELLHSFTNELGLMDNPPYAYWLDHSVNDRRGANLTINGHYLGALEDFTELRKLLGVGSEELFAERATRLRIAIQYFWDDEKQLFADALIDGKRSQMFSEHGNAMALAMNAATPGQAKLVADQLLFDDKHDYMKRESGITMVTPAMSYFLHKGLCKYGYVDESFELFRRRFDMMLDENTNQTLWEEWWLDGTGRTGTFQGGRTRSDAQTESTFPPALFAEYLLGVTPIKPGMKEIQVSYWKSGINQIKGIVPSPCGDLAVEWKLNELNRSLMLDIPAEMIVKLDLKSLDSGKVGQIIINGKRIEVNTAKEQFISMEAGRQFVEF